MPDNLNLKGNSEIMEALKEFEEKSRQKGPSPASLHPGEIPKPRMIRWVMKCSMGLIKDEKQAEYILLGFVVLAIATSLFLFFTGTRNNNISPEELMIEIQKRDSKLLLDRNQ